MSPIHFSTTLEQINSWTILKVPKNESAKLPSRGMVMGKGTINNMAFTAPLEPDGKGSHWLRADTIIAHTKTNSEVSVSLEPTKEWPEPEIPDDIKNALTKNPHILLLWNALTPMARWDWIRWIRSTKQEETRAKRIEVTLSKLQKGSKRPCCFNRTLCTEPSLSHNGILIDTNK